MKKTTPPGSKDFHARLKRIDKTTRKKARATGPTRTGAMDMRQKMRDETRRKRLSWSGVFKTALLMWFLFVGLKTFMAGQMGREAYEERVATLRAGSTPERFLSYALQRGQVMGYLETFTDKFFAANGRRSTPATADTSVQSEDAVVETPAEDDPLAPLNLDQ